MGSVVVVFRSDDRGRSWQEEERFGDAANMGADRGWRWVVESLREQRAYMEAELLWEMSHGEYVETMRVLDDALARASMLRGGCACGVLRIAAPEHNPCRGEEWFMVSVLDGRFA